MWSKHSKAMLGFGQTIEERNERFTWTRKISKSPHDRFQIRSHDNKPNVTDTIEHTLPFLFFLSYMVNNKFHDCPLQFHTYYFSIINFIYILSTKIET